MISIHIVLTYCIILYTDLLSRYTLLLSSVFIDPATTEIYTLSLHDALPIFHNPVACGAQAPRRVARLRSGRSGDRKSTRLNSSHLGISYAVFCLKKKNKLRKNNVLPDQQGRMKLAEWDIRR